MENEDKITLEQEIINTEKEYEDIINNIMNFEEPVIDNSTEENLPF